MSSQQHPHEVPEEPILPEAADPPVRTPLAIEDWISVILMAALACITFANVLVRYFTSSSFAWTEEISVILLIVLTMTASATSFVRGQQIRIELFADGGPAARKRWLAIISHVITLLFFILLTILSARMVWDEFKWDVTSPAIGVPNWWYTIWMPILSVAIALRVGGMLQRTLRSAG